MPEFCSLICSLGVGKIGQINQERGTYTMNNSFSQLSNNNGIDLRSPSDGGVGTRRSPSDGGVGTRRSPSDGGVGTRRSPSDGGVGTR
jgi:hypothetical protein